ncbi:HesA/MoeB/ThiF family protein [Flavobacterium sedimenticola]|uniref:HesA/MoeB/ThiF family protein n=1 Tax=Flavobacterium sedimenticola TaxID=3043286 RepID=A0ABT6XRK1_9FLAO|nr:HesA/MoeB/ThiF family protein [Flavobacterium sedimenticola]MDI9257625.1 HesA/MoeB/ThiF family protein [Flavobacterium sedimenticola]
MQNNRYHKQIQLPEIGLSGQEKIANAKVLVVGAGGLGCPVLQSLVAAGVGHIGIADGDLIEETNLHRQFLFTGNDIGKNKAVVAKAVMSKQNPEVNVEVYPIHFTTLNAFEIVSDYHIIVDCTDDNTTRYLINDIALVKNIPMVYAAVHRFEGQLSVFNYANGPTYRCLFPERKNHFTTNCNDSGVLGVVPNVLGVMQANEVLKIILGIGDVLSGTLLLVNMLNNATQTLHCSVQDAQKTIGMQNGLAVFHQLLNSGIGAVSANDFLAEATQTHSLIIDIRERYEEPQLDIECIRKVPLAQLEDFLKTIDRNQRIILFCQEGNRSKLTGEYLIQNGFTNVAHLSNGVESLLKINADH